MEGEDMTYDVTSAIQAPTINPEPMVMDSTPSVVEVGEEVVQEMPEMEIGQFEEITLESEIPDDVADLNNIELNEELYDEIEGEASSELDDLEEVSEGEEEDIEDGRKIEAVREEIKHEVNEMMNEEVRGLSQEERDALALVLMYMMNELKKEKREDEKSLVEVFVGAMAWLMQEMFVPDESKKQEEQETKRKPQTGWRLRTKEIADLQKAFFQRQQSLAAPRLEMS